MVYKGVHIPYPFIKHIDKVTGRFFAADNKTFIREYRKSDIFYAQEDIEIQLSKLPLDNPPEMGYIPPLPN